MKPEKEPSGNRSISVFLLLETRLLREALASIFRRQADIAVAGVSRYEPLIHRAIAEAQCDILLADHATAKHFPPSFLQDLIGLSAQTKVVFFGMADDPEIFVQVVRSGVSGYLLGDASAENTLSAVRQVARGEAVCPPHLCLQLFHFVARATREGSMVLNRKLCNEFGLTARQQQLVALLARGFTNKEIAASMNLSEFTVKNHVHRIMRQLNAGSRHAAVETVCNGNFSATL